MQIAQDISSRMHDKKRRRSGLRRGFLACIIGEIAKSRCVSYFSTVPYKQKMGGEIDLGHDLYIQARIKEKRTEWIISRYGKN